MSLITRLKADINFAVKAQSSLASSLLKLVLGDCQSKNDYSDEFIVKTCRDIIKNNNKTIELGGESVKLSRENELLRAYIPYELNQAEVEVYADQISTEIMAAKSDGQAIGVLNKHLKMLDLRTSGDVAKISVKRIRGGITI